MEPVEHLSLNSVEGVAEIRVSRPERRNAFTNKMYQGLAQWLVNLDGDEAVRCIVVRGSDGIFTSGSDISFFLDKTPLEREHHFSLVADLFTAPARISKPVIAAVQGFALGGGTGLSAACDFVIAEEGSLFGLPEIDVGIWPCTLMPILTRVVGPRKAYEMAVVGERMDAEEACRIGLVTKVLSKETFEDGLRDFATTLAGRSALVVQMGKTAYQQCLDMEFHKATRFMGRVMALNSASEDAKEGITAFLNKRKPVWRDR